MTVAVKFNLQNTYPLVPEFKETSVAVFEAELENGSSVLLRTIVSNEDHPMTPNVYNLSFGPSAGKGRIDDLALLRYKDYSKVFSTILLHASIYLDRHPGRFIGIDGSTNNRAYLYFRMIQQNYDMLDQYFNMYGIKYYVRITRYGKLQYENPFDFHDISSSLKSIQKNEKVDTSLLYNYFVFGKKL